MTTKRCQACNQVIIPTTPNAIDNMLQQVLTEHPEHNTITALLSKGLNLKYNKRRANRIAAALRRFGYIPHRIRIDKYTLKYIWIKPEIENYAIDL